MTGGAPAYSIARITRWAARAHRFPAPALSEAALRAEFAACGGPAALAAFVLEASPGRRLRFAEVLNAHRADGP